MTELIILQSATDPKISMIFMAAMLGIMYFFMIRPQVRKQKAQSEFQTQITKGSQVVTSSGMHGKVDKIDGNIVTLQVDTKTYIKFSKSAISKDLTEANNGGGKK